MKEKIEAIVFDLGGVLIDWNPKYLYRKIFKDEKDMSYFLSHICTPEWNEKQDGGRSLQEGTALLIEENPQYESEISAYYSRWREMLGGPIEETVAILRELKNQKRLKLYALTNWSAETFPIAYEQYECLHWFEDIIVSGREKMRKPFPEIFRLLTDRFQIIPEKTLFIDDNARNTEGAAKMGFRVLCFNSPEQLRESLQKKGILP